MLKIFLGILLLSVELFCFLWCIYTQNYLLCIFTQIVICYQLDNISFDIEKINFFKSLK